MYKILIESSRVKIKYSIILKMLIYVYKCSINYKYVELAEIIWMNIYNIELIYENVFNCSF